MFDKKEEVSEKEVIDISKFFTLDNEENGKWFDIYVDNVKTGLRLKLVGANSNKATVANEEYKKSMARISQIKNATEKNNQSNIAFAKRLAGFTTDIEFEEGKEFILDGKPVTYSDIEKVYLNSPLIEKEVLNIVAETENFLER